MRTRCTHPFYYETVFDDDYRVFYAYYVRRRGRYVFVGYVPAGYDFIYRGTRVTTVGVMEAINRVPGVIVGRVLEEVLPKSMDAAVGRASMYTCLKNLRKVK